MKFSKRIFLIFTVLLLSLTGCNNSNMDALVDSKENTYNHSTPDTVVVERGDLKPIYDLSLQLAGYEQRSYNISEYTYTRYTEEYNIEVEDVHISVGDVVKKGDVLVSFKSDILDSQKDEKRKQISEDYIKIQHLRNLMELNPAEDRSSEIYSLQQEINVAECYLSDIDDIFDRINIIAETDGTVTGVNSSLLYGHIEVGKTLITVDKNDGYYTFTTDEDIPLKIGETYTAKSAINEYKLKVIASPEDLASSNDATYDDGSDEESDDESSAEDKSSSKDVSSPGDATSTDAEASAEAGGTGKTKVYYLEPVDSSGRLSKSLSVSITTGIIKDAVYVNRRAITRTDEGDAYAIRINEDGTRTGLNLDVGRTFGNDVVILSGLEGGESLILN